MNNLDKWASFLRRYNCITQACLSKGLKPDHRFSYYEVIISSDNRYELAPGLTAGWYISPLCFMINGRRASLGGEILTVIEDKFLLPRKSMEAFSQGLLDATCD